MIYTATLCLLFSFINLSRTQPSLGTVTKAQDVYCGTTADGDCNGRKGVTYTCPDNVNTYGSGSDGNCYWQPEGTNNELVCVNVKTVATCPVEGASCDGCTTMGLKTGVCADGITTWGFIGCTYQYDSTNTAAGLTCLPYTTDEKDCPQIKCCPVLEEPGAFGNPFGIEGHQCCPDGTWAYSIGDAQTFSCGGIDITSGFGERCANPCETARCAGPGCCRPDTNDPITIADCLGNMLDDNNQCMEISCKSFENCAEVFDGCNTHYCISGGVTEIACMDGYENPSCLVCMDGYELNSVGDCEVVLICAKDEVKVQRDTTVTCETDPCGTDENCSTYYNGCNTFENCDTDLITGTSLNCGVGGLTQGTSECRKCIDGYIIDDSGVCVQITCDTFPNCASYYDGCNDCICGDTGTVGGCTKIGCVNGYDDAFCKECKTGYDFDSNNDCVPDPCGDNCIVYYDGCNNCKCESDECDDSICKMYETAICTICDDGYTVNDKGICEQDDSGFVCGDGCVKYTNGCQECECGTKCDYICMTVAVAEPACIGCADRYELTDGECVEIVDDDCMVYGFEPEEAQKELCSICFKKPHDTNVAGVAAYRKDCRAIELIKEVKEDSNIYRASLPDGTWEEAECMWEYCKLQSDDLDCELEYVKLRDGINRINKEKDFLSSENCDCNAFECGELPTTWSGSDKLGIFVGLSVVFAIFGWM